MTKLFQVSVEIEFEMLVVAESADEAKDIADDEWEAELDNKSSPDWTRVCGEITKDSDIPKDWRGCRPYGDIDDFDDDRVEAIVEIIERERREAAMLRPAPGQKELPL